MSAAGVRSTRQRAAISTLLETLDDFRSAQELRRTAPARREHRSDHRLPHTAVDGILRTGGHTAHRHR